MSDMVEEETEEYSEKLNFEIWKKIVNLIKPYKKYLIAILVINFFQIMCINFFPLLTRNIIDNYANKRDISDVIQFAILFFTLVTIIASTTFLMFIFTGKLEVSTKHHLRKSCFDTLQTLDLSYYDRTKAGWIIARVGQDIQNLMEIFAWSLLDFSYGIFAFIFYLIAMCILNVKLALISFVGLPVILVLSFIFHNAIIKIHRMVKKANSRITAAYNEDIQGAKTSKVFVREAKNTSDFTKLAKSLRERKLRSSFISAIFIPSISFIGCIGSVLVLNIGGNEVLKGAVTVGTFYALFYYSVEIYEPARQVAALFSDMLYAQAGAERVFSLIEEVPKISDSLELQNTEFPKVKGEVEFNNVSFYYENSNRPVLKNFNLKVEQGKTIALVGETGSGKSTIVNLLARFYEPTEGQILIDGVDYRDRPQQWLHSSLGIVLQTPHLFSGTVAENIRYGKHDATDEEIVNACKLVYAHDFISQLENGYETNLGEGANIISTGQKQLISIARAIIRNPSMMILDEATSSVDTETEFKIQKSFNNILKNRTSFVVAHRLSTIRNADLILVIQDGEVLERGTHDELMKNKGHYYDLYVKQFIEDEQKKIS